MKVRIELTTYADKFPSRRIIVEYPTRKHEYNSFDQLPKTVKEYISTHSFNVKTIEPNKYRHYTIDRLIFN